MTFIDIWAQAMGNILEGDSGDEQPPSVETIYGIPLIAEPKPETEEERNCRMWKALQDASRS
jgi:hypothetical protein